MRFELRIRMTFSRFWRLLARDTFLHLQLKARSGQFGRTSSVLRERLRRSEAYSEGLETPLQPVSNTGATCNRELAEKIFIDLYMRSMQMDTSQRPRVRRSLHLARTNTGVSG